MARTEARIFTSIWADPDFRALPMGAQHLYLFLVSQPDLSHCGVIALRPKRWAAMTDGMTVAALEKNLEALEGCMRPFIITDAAKGELLIRSLVRRDRILRSPKMANPLAADLAVVESDRLRSVISSEIERAVADDDVHPLLKDFAEGWIKRLSSQVNTLCHTVPDRVPDTVPDTLRGRGSVTNPSLLVKSKATPVTNGRRDQPGEREDVDRLCEHMADSVENQTGVRPRYGVQWRRAARLMLDDDKRTEAQVHAAIDWCASDEFWRPHVLSLPKLRTKYVQLQAGAKMRPGRRPSTTDRAVQQPLEDLLGTFDDSSPGARATVGLNGNGRGI